MLEQWYRWQIAENSWMPKHPLCEIADSVEGKYKKPHNGWNKSIICKKGMLHIQIKKGTEEKYNLHIESFTCNGEYKSTTH